jgi:hypothetical protein
LLIAKPSSLAEEDGKWGVNMLASEQPQIYEDLFTLTPSEIENGTRSALPALARTHARTHRTARTARTPDLDG